MRSKLRLTKDCKIIRKKKRNSTSERVRIINNRLFCMIKSQGRNQRIIHPMVKREIE